MRRPAGDDGTVLLLVLGFTVVLLVAVAGVVNVSAVVLAQRGAASAADGAAVSAAQALDLEQAYRDGLAAGLPLSPAEARRRVADHQALVAASQPGLRLALRLEGRTAVVSAVRAVRLPLRVPGLGPVEVRAVARARAPVVP